MFGPLIDVPVTAGEVRLVRMAVLVGLLVLSAAVYSAAVRLVLRYAWPRGTTSVVLGVAMASRALLLTALPILSTDFYRYVWDARVQAAGINPYRYVTADPALATLRDSSIYTQISRADFRAQSIPRRRASIRGSGPGLPHRHAAIHAWLRSRRHYLPAVTAVPGRAAG